MESTMKARRFSTLDKLNLTPKQCKSVPEQQGRGTYKWGANIRVNTPDGIGELYDDVYTNDTITRVFFEGICDTRTYPIDQISRVVRSRS